MNSDVTAVVAATIVASHSKTVVHGIAATATLAATVVEVVE